METHDNAERLIRELTEHQNSLFAYLYSLLGDLHETTNVLQETNLVIWRKANDFQPGTQFNAWARKIAYFQVLAHLRDRKRDRHLFDAELLEQLATVSDGDAASDEDDRHRLALRDCLTQLGDQHRHMISVRYSPGGSIQKVARMFGKSESAIKMTLLRLRQTLAECIRGRLAEE